MRETEVCDTKERLRAIPLDAFTKDMITSSGTVYFLSVGDGQELRKCYVNDMVGRKEAYLMRDLGTHDFPTVLVCKGVDLCNLHL